LRNLISVVLLCAVTLPGVCQSGSKYQVATILDVKAHAGAAASASDPSSYDVTVKVGDTVYVTLYTPHPGENDAKYAAGRDLLVQVGKDTITYNDIMGRSYEVPIQSQKPAPPKKESR